MFVGYPLGLRAGFAVPDVESSARAARAVDGSPTWDAGLRYAHNMLVTPLREGVGGAVRAGHDWVHVFSLRVHVPEFACQPVASSFTICCMKWLAFPAVLVAGLLCAAPAGADGEQFRTDLSGTGIPPESYLTLEMWANTACDLQPQLGLSEC